MSRQVRLSEIAEKSRGLSEDAVRTVFLAARAHGLYDDKENEVCQLIDGETVYAISGDLVFHIRQLAAFLEDLPNLARP
jgi:hypothetical protein